MPIDEIFNAIREEANKQEWSKGVGLSRSAIKEIRKGTTQWNILIGEPGTPVSYDVKLWPDDCDWSCDCGGLDPCRHVIAAAIFAKQGASVPVQSSASGRVHYEFIDVSGSLALKRFIVNGSHKIPLEKSLRRYMQENANKVAATSYDLNCDAAMQAYTPLVQPKKNLFSIFDSLHDQPNIFLDGQKVHVSRKKIEMELVVEDLGGEFTLRSQMLHEVQQSFENGAVLCHQTLHPFTAPKIDPRFERILCEKRRFGERDASELASEILPELRKQIKVKVLTDRLPDTLNLQPRLLFMSREENYRLHVRPLIAYGDPIIATVQNGKLQAETNKTVPRRLRAQEVALREALQHRFAMELDKEVQLSAEQADRFRKSLAGWNRVTQLATPEDFRVDQSLQLQIDEQDGQYLWNFTTDNNNPIPARSVLKAWKMGESMVPLIEGGWAKVPQNWLQSHGSRLKLLMQIQEEKGEIPGYFLPDLVALAEDNQVNATFSFAQMMDQWSEGGFEEVEGLNARLRDYQRQGVSWLQKLVKSNVGGMLADDMGLGKTLQIICILRGRSLVIAPTSVLGSWQEQIKKFRPSLRVELYHGAQRKLPEGNSVVLTSYNICRLDNDLLTQRPWDMVVLDEAQTIKNPDSMVSKACFKLQAKVRMNLSGTPVENRLDDLWSQFHFINPGLLGTHSDFKNMYAKPIQQGDELMAKQLRNRIKPFILRRLKGDVAKELPKKTEMLLTCHLNPDEREVYEAIFLSTRQEVINQMDSGGSIMQLLEALLRLRQAACHPGLLPGHTHYQTSSKVSLLMEKLDEIVSTGSKALVFSQWTSLLDLIAKPLVDSSLAFSRLDGATADRQKVVAEFQERSGPPIMLISLKAGGVGITLTEADHVFLMDPWWNPAVEDQAIDRVHRIGQTKPVFISRMVAENTVEEKVLELQEKKKGLAASVLSEADQASGLTKDDIMSLLQI